MYKQILVIAATYMSAEALSIESENPWAVVGAVKDRVGAVKDRVQQNIPNKCDIAKAALKTDPVVCCIYLFFELGGVEKPACENFIWACNYDCAPLN